MTEDKAKRRGWVKNAAIIFLAVLLILTFSSNTIMNRSLPEVATAYTAPGTITTRIRGSGTVEANAVYEVSVKETRKIQSVAVRLGDKVEVGDVLFILADTEGEELKEAQDLLDQYNVDLQKTLIENNGASYASQNAAISRAKLILQEAIAERDSNTFNQTEYSTLKNAVDTAQAEYDRLDNEVSRLESSLELAAGAGASTAEIETQLFYARSKLSTAGSELAKAKLAFEDIDSKRTIWLEKDALVKTQQETVDDLVIALNDQMRQDAVQQALDDLDLQILRDNIKEQEELVAKLKLNATEAVIESPVAGVVKSIGVSAGNTTEYDATMAEIEVTDRGYALSFPVDNAQAQKVKIGDVAEVTNYYYWGNEITAVLGSINNDPDNPGKGKILKFDLSGDIETGTQLSVSVGQRSQEYSAVVPKSAIREDSNGKFVFVVVSKSSSLVNRYIATRVPVTVLAEDDTNAAIEGGITNYDYVITTSSKPIEHGMQVRMVDA